jgi:VWFA-related protein
MDGSGVPVRGLQRQDFTLLDDKRPQNILSFHAADAEAAMTTDPPIEIVLVVDAVNTSFRLNAYERDQVRKFLLRNGGKLAWPVSFAIFSEDGPKVERISSRDGNALAAVYDQYQSGLRSTYLSNRAGWGVDERISISLKALTSIVAYEKTQPGRKLMIWLSRGWPMGPLTASLTNREQQEFFNSIVTLSSELRLARITLYSVDPLSSTDADALRNSYYENFLEGVTSRSHALPGNLGLQVLAVQSGGRVFTSSIDLADAIANCVADADAFYVLSFAAARAEQADDYHSLRITVDRPGITVRTRTGYYAQP